MSSAEASPFIGELLSRGEIGGRTVQIVDSGAVECHRYPAGTLPDGYVRIRTVRSAISPGTEMTYFGRSASNVHLHRRWNAELRLFEAGPPSTEYPIVFGYRAAGEVVESASPLAPVGMRVWGRWRHTELTSLPAEVAAGQQLPDPLSWDDGVDIAQMAPICLNAVLAAGGEHVGRAAVVFGAGVIGLITAQLVRREGASPVYVVDRLPERLAIAESLGMEVMRASDDASVAMSLKRLLGADGVAVAWECTGSVAALGEAVRTVRPRGAVIAVGFYQGDASALELGAEFHHNAVRIVSAQIGNVQPPATRESLQQRALELARHGSLTLGGLPRRTLPVERVADGFADLQRPSEVLQVALTYDEGAA